MIRGWDTTRRCARRPVLWVWLAAARTAWEWGRQPRLGRLGARRVVVTLCPDLREWYVMSVTEGAACASLKHKQRQLALYYVQ
jgi:hypothetical protein